MIVGMALCCGVHPLVPQPYPKLVVEGGDTSYNNSNIYSNSALTERYSTSDWIDNIVNMPASSLLVRSRQILQYRSFPPRLLAPL